MKQLKILSIMLLLGLGLSNCEKIDEQTQFNLDYTTSITVPSNSVINLPIDLNTPNMTTDSRTEFELNDTRVDLVEEVKLTKARLKITDPNDEEFDFVESIEIYINADGLSELKIAEKTNIDDSIGDEMELTVFDNDLSEYIKTEKFSLRAKVITDQLITQDVDIDVFSTFFVDSKILGI